MAKSKAQQFDPRAERYKMTESGRTRLKEALFTLETEELPKVLEALGEARSYGDLSENSEYKAAREEQAQLETRRRDLEDLISNAVIVEYQHKEGECTLGSTVTVEIGKATAVYTIVNSLDANPFECKISDVSPLGRALIGKVVGESAEYEAPGGKTVAKIKKIEHKQN
ncbi:MAG: transcription elongation factor GreA [Oscillospiraceae bacterium]|jgi:transcription elongation factor GreA|nr:transcription elongation factor GreA [Oscillospiraceae bacterium]